MSPRRDLPPQFADVPMPGGLEAVRRYGAANEQFDQLNETQSVLYREVFTAVNDMHVNWQDKDSPISIYTQSALRHLLTERLINGITPDEHEHERIAQWAKQGIVNDFIHATQAAFETMRGGDPSQELTPIVAGRYARSQVNLLPELITHDDPAQFIDSALGCYLAAIIAKGAGTGIRVKRAFETIINDYHGNELATEFEKVSWRELGQRSAQDSTEATKLRLYTRLLPLRALEIALQEETQTSIDHHAHLVHAFAQRVPLNPAVMNLLQKEEDAIEQLDWEVFPPGKLREHAEAIITKHTERKNTPARIELERLRTLELVRTEWEQKHGHGSTYYSRGMATGRRIIRDEAGREQPDEYIILALQERDADGTIHKEHAVAESPIAGSNALYVQREDVNGWKWEELLSHPKSDVRAMGARRILHTASGGDMAADMAEKVQALLGCPPEDFLRMEFNGRKNGVLQTYLASLALREFSI